MNRTNIWEKGGVPPEQKEEKEEEREFRTYHVKAGSFFSVETKKDISSAEVSTEVPAEVSELVKTLKEQGFGNIEIEYTPKSGVYGFSIKEDHFIIKGSIPSKEAKEAPISISVVPRFEIPYAKSRYGLEKEYTGQAKISSLNELGRTFCDLAAKILKNLTPTLKKK